MHKNDLEAIKLLKEWSTWLVAIQIAAIGAIGAGIKDVSFNAPCEIEIGIFGIRLGFPCDPLARFLALGVVVLFGVSIIAALYLLLALPAISQRLPPEPGKDIYSMRTASGFRLRLNYYVQVGRWGSVAGFLFLAALILLIVGKVEHTTSNDLRSLQEHLGPLTRLADASEAIAERWRIIQAHDKELTGAATTVQPDAAKTAAAQAKAAEDKITAELGTVVQQMSDLSREVEDLRKAVADTSLPRREEDLTQEQRLKLQARLSQLGYDLGPKGVDGNIGMATHRAIAAWQRTRPGEPYNGVLTEHQIADLLKP
jgi:Putative peptidoglycan binding domain